MPNRRCPHCQKQALVERADHPGVLTCLSCRGSAMTRAEIVRRLELRLLALAKDMHRTLREMAGVDKLN